MNYLNEYQTMKDEFYSLPRFKNGKFPTYDKWVKGYIQSNILDSTVSSQGIVDITPNLLYENTAPFLLKKNQENKTLSIKERLRKKLLEKKRKEVEEMLKRL